MSGRKQSREQAQAAGRRRRALGLALAALILVAAAAVWWLNREPRLDPENQAVLEVMQSHLESREMDQGIEAGLTYLEAHPDARGVHYALGVLYLAKLDDQAAVEALTEATRRDPDHADAFVQLASAQTALGDLEGASDSLRTALDLVPDNPEASLLLGRNLSQLGEYEEAREHLQAAEAVKPAEARFQLGLLARKTGDNEAAAEAFRGSLAADPEHLGSIYNLGQTIILLGDKEEGERLLQHHKEVEEEKYQLDQLRKATHMEWAQAENYVMLGNYRLAHQEPQEAVQQFRQALDKDPEHMGALMGLGRAFMELGRISDGAIWFSRVLERDPENPEAHFFIGLSLHMGGRFEEAREAFAISQRSREWGAPEYLFLGNALAQTGAISDARIAYERVLDLAPELPETYYRIGLMEYIDGNLPVARAALAKKVAMSPDDAESLMLLGLAEFRLGDRVAAERAFSQARSLHTLSLHGPEQVEAMLQQFAVLPGAEQALDLYRSLAG